ncbi:uncharacterized protein V6R79_017910 [Siganus canaliculatus]
MREGITESFGAAIHALNTSQLTDGVINKSKRMMLGVGLLGTRTAVFNKALKYSQMFLSEQRSSVWGKSDITLPPHFADFVNGIAVHSMDFDDTWHPATHLSGAVLPALLALAESLPSQPSGSDLLLAFNVGTEVQGRLMRFSRAAFNIPERLHPPSVVGVMGSAAASAKLLGLSPAQCGHALAIAASSAGAPLANTATQTKPLHVGNAARKGLEAAQLAPMGLEGNPAILDMHRGLGVYYKDYSPSKFTSSNFKWILEDQDVAEAQIDRPTLRELLFKVKVKTPHDNQPSFDKMYCEIEIQTVQSLSSVARCDTFYGHWRRPLSLEDLVEKFRSLAGSVLCTEGVEGVIDVTRNIERV